MSKAGYIERMDRGRLQSLVTGCLRSAVNAHGPIHDADTCSAAAKRVTQQLLATIRQDIEREKSARAARKRGSQEGLNP